MSRDRFPRGIDEVDRAARESGQLDSVRQRGSHRVYKGRNGKIVVAPDRREYPEGTRRSIRKMMEAAGFLIFVGGVTLAALLIFA